MVEGRDGRTKEGRGERAARTDREQTAPAGHFETFAKNASYTWEGFVKDGLKNIRTKKRRREEPAEDAVT